MPWERVRPSDRRALGGARDGSGLDLLRQRDRRLGRGCTSGRALKAPGAPPQAIVIFGASGDLTKRKLLPAFFDLFAEGLLPKGFTITGYARTEMSDEEFRKLAHDAVKDFGSGPPEGEVWSDFTQHLRYVTGEFSKPGSMDHVVDHLDSMDESHGTEGRRFFYAATPPAAYPDIAARILETGLATGSKIVIEKPFGHDLDSASQLNATLHQVFDES